MESLTPTTPLLPLTAIKASTTRGKVMPKMCADGASMILGGTVYADGLEEPTKGKPWELVASPVICSGLRACALIFDLRVLKGIERLHLEVEAVDGPGQAAQVDWVEAGFKEYSKKISRSIADNECDRVKNGQRSWGRVSESGFRLSNRFWVVLFLRYTFRVPEPSNDQCPNHRHSEQYPTDTVEPGIPYWCGLFQEELTIEINLSGHAF